jgi:hypothetical protein
MMEADNPLNNPPGDSGLPDPSSMGLSPAPKSKKPGNKGVLIGVIAAVVVVVAILLLVVVFSSSNQKKTTQNQYDAGYKKGAEEQKAKSDAEFISQQSKDTRTYVSDVEFGSFSLPLPKSWSFAITPQPNDGTFSGIADPDYIDTEKETHVFSFDLKRGDYDRLVTDYNNKASKSNGAIKASDITVSGIPGRRYVGVFDTKNKVKSDIVILKYREKVITIKTDDPDKYGAAFNSVLQNLKLNQ